MDLNGVSSEKKTLKNAFLPYFPDPLLTHLVRVPDPEDGEGDDVLAPEDVPVMIIMIIIIIIIIIIITLTRSCTSHS